MISKLGANQCGVANGFLFRKYTVDLASYLSTEYGVCIGNEIVVKVQFRGPELFKKNGALFVEELYLPGIFVPSRTSWRYDCKWMASI